MDRRRVRGRASLSGALCLLALTVSGANANDFNAGTLKCRFTGSDAAIHFGSNRNFSCTFFYKNSRRKERYAGNVKKYGVEVGFIGQRWLSWRVVSSKSRPLKRGALAGRYRGLTAEASVGTGFAINILAGGSILLEPLGHRQKGVNVTAGLMVLTLKRRR